MFPPKFKKKIQKSSPIFQIFWENCTRAMDFWRILCFSLPVPCPNLERHVGAYNGIAAQGFRHDVVNQQYNFVNPNNKVTTNHVEAMWQRAKANFKSMFGPTNREIIQDYLVEFMWNQRFKDHSYFSFWIQVTQLYSV